MNIANSPEEAKSTIIDKARVARVQAVTVKTSLDAGPTSADMVYNIFRHVAAAKSTLETSKLVAGLDPAFVADVDAVIAAMQAILTQVSSSFPASGGYLLKDQIVGDQIVARTFTTAQMAGLSTALGNLIAVLTP